MTYYKCVVQITTIKVNISFAGFYVKAQCSDVQLSS